VVVNSDSAESDTAQPEMTEDKRGETTFDLIIEPGPVQQEGNVSYKIFTENFMESERASNVDGEQEVQDVDLEEESLDLQQTSEMSYIETYQELQSGGMHYLLQRRDNASYWMDPSSCSASNYCQDLIDGTQGATYNQNSVTYNMYFDIGSNKLIGGFSFYKNILMESVYPYDFTIMTSDNGEDFHDVLTGNADSSSTSDCYTAEGDEYCRVNVEFDTLINTEYIGLRIHNSPTTADPTCALNRGSHVYSGCGYIYQSSSNAIQQCGHGSPTPFIWDDTAQSACGINRADTVYTGCGYIYQKEHDRNTQCGSGGTAYFIPTEGTAAASTSISGPVQVEAYINAEVGNETLHGRNAQQLQNMIVGAVDAITGPVAVAEGETVTHHSGEGLPNGTSLENSESTMTYQNGVATEQLLEFEHVQHNINGRKRTHVRREPHADGSFTIHRKHSYELLQSDTPVPLDQNGTVTMEGTGTNQVDADGSVTSAQESTTAHLGAEDGEDLECEGGTNSTADENGQMCAGNEVPAGYDTPEEAELESETTYEATMTDITDVPGCTDPGYLFQRESLEEFLERHAQEGRHPVPAGKAIRHVPDPIGAEPEDAAAGVPAFLEFLEQMSPEEFKEFKTRKEIEQVLSMPTIRAELVQELENNKFKNRAAVQTLVHIIGRVGTKQPKAAMQLIEIANNAATNQLTRTKAVLGLLQGKCYNHKPVIHALSKLAHEPQDVVGATALHVQHGLISHAEHCRLGKYGDAKEYRELLQHAAQQLSHATSDMHEKRMLMWLIAIANTKSQHPADTRAVAAIARSKTHPKNLREHAIEALGSMYTPEGIRHLESLLQDPEDRRHHKLAKRALSGKHLLKGDKRKALAEQWIQENTASEATVTSIYSEAPTIAPTTGWGGGGSFSILWNSLGASITEECQAAAELLEQRATDVNQLNEDLTTKAIEHAQAQSDADTAVDQTTELLDRARDTLAALTDAEATKQLLYDAVRGFGQAIGSMILSAESAYQAFMDTADAPTAAQQAQQALDSAVEVQNRIIHWDDARIDVATTSNEEQKADSERQKNAATMVLNAMTQAVNQLPDDTPDATRERMTQAQAAAQLAKDNAFATANTQAEHSQALTDLRARTTELNEAQTAMTSARQALETAQANLAANGGLDAATQIQLENNVNTAQNSLNERQTELVQKNIEVSEAAAEEATKNLASVTAREAQNVAARQAAKTEAERAHQRDIASMDDSRMEASAQRVEEARASLTAAQTQQSEAVGSATAHMNHCTSVHSNAVMQAVNSGAIQEVPGTGSTGTASGTAGFYYEKTWPMPSGGKFQAEPKAGVSLTYEQSTGEDPEIALKGYGAVAVKMWRFALDPAAELVLEQDLTAQTRQDGFNPYLAIVGVKVFPLASLWEGVADAAFNAVEQNYEQQIDMWRQDMNSNVTTLETLRGYCKSPTDGAELRFEFEIDYTFIEVEMRMVICGFTVKGTLAAIGGVGMKFGYMPLSGLQGLTHGLDPEYEGCTSGKLLFMTPLVNLRLLAELAVDLWLVKAGVGVEVTLVQVSCPLSLEWLQGVSPQNKVSKIGIEVEAFGGRVYGFIDRISGITINKNGARWWQFWKWRIERSWARMGEIDFWKWGGISPLWKSYETKSDIPTPEDGVGIEGDGGFFQGGGAVDPGVFLIRAFLPDSEEERYLAVWSADDTVRNSASSYLTTTGDKAEATVFNIQPSDRGLNTVAYSIKTTRLGSKEVPSGWGLSAWHHPDYNCNRNVDGKQAILAAAHSGNNWPMHWEIGDEVNGTFSIKTAPGGGPTEYGNGMPDGIALVHSKENNTALAQSTEQRGDTETWFVYTGKDQNYEDWQQQWSFIEHDLAPWEDRYDPVDAAHNGEDGCCRERSDGGTMNAVALSQRSLESCALLCTTDTGCNAFEINGCLQSTLADVGRNDCDQFEDYEPVTSKEQCEKVVDLRDDITNGFDGEVNWEHYPKGCFKSHDDKVMYNIHAVGQSRIGEEAAQTICVNSNLTEVAGDCHGNCYLYYGTLGAPVWTRCDRTGNQKCLVKDVAWQTANNLIQGSAAASASSTNISATESLFDFVVDLCLNNQYTNTTLTLMCETMKDSQMVRAIFADTLNSFIPPSTDVQASSEGAFIRFPIVTQVGDATVNMEATIGYTLDSHELSLTMHTEQPIQLAKSAKLTDLDVAVSISLPQNGSATRLLHAYGSAEAAVEVAGMTVTGQVVLELKDGGMYVDGSLGVSAFDLNTHARVNTGELLVSFINKRDRPVEWNLRLASTMTVKLNQASDAIDIQFEGVMDKSGRIEVSSRTSSNQMIHHVFGVSFLSVGKLSVIAVIERGHLITASMGGLLCIGSEEDCETGIPTIDNTIVDLTLTYHPSQKHLTFNNLYNYHWDAEESFWSLYAKVSSLDLEKVVSAITSPQLAQSIPRSLNFGFLPLQDHCVENSHQAGCYFIVGASSKQIDISTTTPPIRLAKGFSLYARLQDNRLLTVSTALPSEPAPLPGTESMTAEGHRGNFLARLRAAFTIELFNINAPLTPEFPPQNTRWEDLPVLGRPGHHALQTIFSFGAPTSGEESEKVFFSMNFERMLPFVVQCVSHAVPPLAAPLAEAQAAMQQPLAWVSNFMERYKFVLSYKSDFDHFKIEKLSNGYCSDWVYLPEGAYPPQISLSENPKQECAQRCHRASNNRAQHGTTYGDQAFYLRTSDKRCACSYGACSSRVGGSAYKSYSMVPQGYFVASAIADEGFAVTIAAQGREENKALLFAFNVDTHSFGQLMESVFGSNPFADKPLFSNMDAQALVASKEFSLAAGVYLPEPYQDVRYIEKGLCLDARLGKPTMDCGDDQVCKWLDSKLNTPDASASAEMCVTDGNGMWIKFALNEIRLNEQVMMSEASIEYKQTMQPFQWELGAQIILHVQMGTSDVEFLGRLFVANGAFGVSAAMSGMMSNLFGNGRLHAYDLVVEFTVTSGAPMALTIGGGLCVGKKSNCRSLVSGDDEEELLAKGYPTVPHDRMGEEMSTGLVQQAAGTLGADDAIAFKLYAGFDPEGSAFFYAGVTAISIKKFMCAISNKCKVPDWMGEIELLPFDRDACDNNGGSACFLYASGASREVTIDTLNPPITIPQGFAIQGTLRLWKVHLAFKLRVEGTKFWLELMGSAIKFGEMQNGDPMIIISRSKQDDVHSPALAAEGDTRTRAFGLSFVGYARIGTFAEAEVEVTISSTTRRFALRDVKLFGIFKAQLLAIEMSNTNPGVAVEAKLGIPTAVIRTVQNLCRGAATVIKAVKDSIMWVFDKVDKVFEKADEKLKKRQDTLKKKKKKCKKKTTWLGEQACYTGLSVIQGAVAVAKWFFDRAKDAFDAGKAIVEGALSKIHSTLLWLTETDIQAIHFKAGGIVPEVYIGIDIVRTDEEHEGDVKAVGFDLDLKGTVMKMGQNLFKNFFKKKRNSCKDSVEDMEDDIEIPEEDELIAVGFSKAEIEELQIPALHARRKRQNRKRPRKILPNDFLQQINRIKAKYRPRHARNQEL
jgi:hypothetical protein